MRTLAQQDETEKEHYQFMGSLIGYVTPEKITPQRVQVDDLLTLGLSSTGTEDSEGLQIKILVSSVVVLANGTLIVR